MIKHDEKSLYTKDVYDTIFVESRVVAKDYGDVFISTIHIYVAFLRYLDKVILNKATHDMSKNRATSLKFLLSQNKIIEKDMKSIIDDVLIIDPATAKNIYIKSDAKTFIKDISATVEKCDMNFVLEKLIVLMTNIKSTLYKSIKVMNPDLDSTLLAFKMNEAVIDTEDATSQVNKRTKTDMVTEFIKTESYDGFDKELDKIMLRLSSPTNNSVFLSGNSGVGKTSLVKELSYRMANNKAVPLLNNKKIYEINLQYLFASNTIKTLFTDAVNTCNKDNSVMYVNLKDTYIIFSKIGDSFVKFIYELANIIKENKCKIIIEVSSSTSGQLSNISTVFNEVYRVLLANPSKEAIRNAIKNKIDKQFDYDEIFINDVLINLKRYNSVENISGILDFVSTTIAYKLENPNGKELGFDDIRNILKITNDINLVADPITDLEKLLKEEIIGQDDAINKIIKSLNSTRYAINSIDKPLRSFIFAGPSGVGKTQVAKLIAQGYYGDAERIYIQDMAMLSEKHSATNLIGSPKSYLGYGEETPIVFHLKNLKRFVLVLDEMNLAHEKIFDLFLKALDEGKFQNPSTGEEYSLSEIIVIATTNEGFLESQGSNVNGIFNSGETIADKLRENKKFSRRFIGRFDEVIEFKHVDKKLFRERIIVLKNRILADSTYRKDIEFADKDIDAILKRADDMGDSGVRDLERAIRNYLVEKIEEEVNNENK